MFGVKLGVEILLIPLKVPLLPLLLPLPLLLFLPLLLLLLPLSGVELGVDSWRTGVPERVSMAWWRRVPAGRSRWENGMEERMDCWRGMSLEEKSGLIVMIERVRRRE